MKTLQRLSAVFKYINNHPLAGKHRLIAYSSFLHWQLTQFVNPTEIIVPFVGNTRLSVRKGMKGATGNIYLGLHDFCEMGFLLHFLNKEDLFVDIGANIGTYSILASGVNGSHTLAFEPSLQAFAQLQKNVAINHLTSRINTYNLCLGGKTGKLYFTTSLDTVNHVVPPCELETAGNTVEVDVDSLDNIVKEKGVPAFIKIDVEGFETEVINGMEETLTNETLKAIIIELNGLGMRYGYDENEIHNKLLLKSFQPYLYDPFKRKFTVSTGYGKFNTLYLRDMEFIKKRVEEAEFIHIFNEKF